MRPGPLPVQLDDAHTRHWAAASLPGGKWLARSTWRQNNDINLSRDDSTDSAHVVHGVCGTNEWLAPRKSPELDPKRSFEHSFERRLVDNQDIKTRFLLSLLCSPFQCLSRSVRKSALCDVTKCTITPLPGVANTVSCFVEGPTTALEAENRGLNVHFSTDLWRLIKCGSSTESRMKNNAFKMDWIWVTQY